MSVTSSEIRGTRLVNYQMLTEDIWKKMTRNAVVTTGENVTSAQLGLLPELLAYEKEPTI